MRPSTVANILLENISTADIQQFLDDGQRAYRLRRSIASCPAFDNEVFRRAWKAGYYSARDGVSVQAASQTFLRELG